MEHDLSEMRRKLEMDTTPSNCQSATIEDLMKMLNSRSDNEQIDRRAPPIPPKPKSITKTTPNGEHSFRKYNSTNLILNTSEPHTSKVDINFNNDKFYGKSETTFQSSGNSSMQRDHNNDNNKRGDKFFTSRFTDANNIFIPDSPVDTSYRSGERGVGVTDESYNSRGSFVPKTARNSSLDIPCGGDTMNIPFGKKKVNKSTVEIEEIEEKSNNTCSNDDFNNEIYLSGKNPPIFSRGNQERLFFENNYARPVVTGPDDEDEDTNVEDEVPVSNAETDLETLLNNSTISQPPRTSTPSFDCTASSSDQSQFENNNPLNSTYNKLDIDSSSSVLSSKTRQEIDEALDVSKDSDTCIFDVSDGCVVAVDSTNSTNSQSTTNNLDQSTNNTTSNRTTGAGLDFTENVANRFSTPKQFLNNNKSQPIIPSMNDMSNTKVEKLEKLTTSLMEEVSRLSQQVEDLTNQMNALQLTNNSSSQYSLSNFGNGSSMSTLNNVGLSSYGTQSISSHAIPNISTLRRENLSSACGSISNLSQIGSSSMINLPSSTDYISTKHGGKELTFCPEAQLIRMSLYDNQINIRVPTTIFNHGYDPDKLIEPPSARLELGWVHGYRGRDCRCNLYFLPTKECVYFVASIVVLYNPVQNSQRHYLGHTDSVKCLAIHPNRIIIASGQSAIQNRRDKRPIVRVWSTVSLATLRVISFNEDFDRSICCLAFSKHDCGATLAVVDESNEHTITLLDWQREKNWRVAEANSGHEPVLAIDFHPIDKYSLIAIGKSSINFWDIRGMTMSKKAGLFDKYDKPKYVLCLTFNDQGETITGDSNGNIIIWPRGNNRPRKIIANVHSGGVFSILNMKDRTYLSGGKDRRVVEWDENFNVTGRELELPEHCGGVRFITSAKGDDVLIGTLRNCILMGSLDVNFSMIVQGHASAISTIVPHPNRDEYLTAGLDDQMYLYSAITHQVLWRKCLTMPACSAAFSPDQTLIIVGSTSGKWLVMDSSTRDILFTKCDGSGSINCVKFSPDGQYFAMGSTDSHIYIYQVTSSGNKFWRVGSCAGHTGPVKEMDWSIDSMFLRSQSMNFELMFWKAVNCRPIEDNGHLDNVDWYTENCTLGFSVFGIWPNESSLVEYCDKSPKNEIIVSSMDSGHLNVFQWPASYYQCLPKQFYGNVDKFDKIKFLPDGKKLVAISSKNCVISEWILVNHN